MCTTHIPCTRQNHTSSIPHNSMTVNVTPSHPLSIHTYNSTCITVTATTASTKGTKTTSQKDQRRENDYRHHTSIQAQSLKCEKSHHTAGQYKRNQKQTRGAQIDCLFMTHMQISSQFRKPSSSLKQKHPQYITSPPFNIKPFI